MCVLRQKPLEKIVQPCIEIERRMQHTKSVLSRGFERLFDPLIGDHRVALASGTHCCNGASRCSVKRIKFGEEMGRMVFYTFANTGVIHAEKATTPERYLELLTGCHKSRSMTIERCLLLPLGAQLCLPLRPGYLQAPFVTPHNGHARSAVFLFKTRFFSLLSARWRYFIQLLYVFRQEICVLTLNLGLS